MPFSLKNSGAVYQRLADKVFAPQIGRNIEIFIDEIFIKNTNEISFQSDVKRHLTI